MREIAAKARRCAVTEPLIGGYDYADAFEVDLAGGDTRPAGQVFQAGLVGAPRVLRRTVLIAHRYLLRFRLGPASGGDDVFGWQILTREPDVIRLQAAGPLMRGVLVARRIGPTRAALTTSLYYERPRLARIIWAIVGPLHRRIAPYLLERAGRPASPRRHRSGDRLSPQ